MSQPPIAMAHGLSGIPNRLTAEAVLRHIKR